jgi:hypothetical protein
VWSNVPKMMIIVHQFIPWTPMPRLQTDSFNKAHITYMSAFLCFMLFSLWNLGRSNSTRVNYWADGGTYLDGAEPLFEMSTFLTERRLKCPEISWIFETDVAVAPADGTVRTFTRARSERATVPKYSSESRGYLANKGSTSVY